MLHGVTRDLRFGGRMLVFLIIALLASYLPARRATRVQPMEVLKGS